jgi:cathepsin E
MFLLASVVPFIVLASTVVAGPIVVRDSRVSLPLKKRVVKSTVTGRHLVHGRQDRTGGHNAFLTNAMTYYQAIVGVGMPPTNCGSSQPRSFPVSYTPFTDTLLVDTGSSNTWVGAGKAYVKTKTSVETSNSVVSIVFCLASANQRLCFRIKLMAARQ